MQPQLPKENSLQAKNKLKNSLLSVAQMEFPFENFPGPSLLVPVQPETTALRQNDPVSTTELDSFIGQETTSQIHHLPPNPIPPSLLNSSAKQHQQQPQQQSEQREQPQPQRQSYFTSILSSLPNLSLSVITGDNSRSLPSPDTAQKSTHELQSQQLYEHHQPPHYHQGPNTLNTGITQQPHLPLQPPPTVPPQSAGSGSYRLGNQRRLKYAPPPDLTSSTSNSQNYQAPSLQPSIPVSSNFFNPGPQVFKSGTSRIDNQNSSTLLIPSSIPSNSFSSSPVAPLPPPPSNVYLPSRPALNHQPQTLASPAQAIPSRFPEPATPQNTPAEHVYSGFNAYRHQQVVQEPHSLQLFGESTLPSSDKTFTPISAARVTEKLENLIAEQNDDTLSVKSELSAEVATITANIAEPRKELLSEELTEIDLNATGNTDTVTQSNLVRLPISSESALLHSNEQNQTLDSFAVPSATNFFVNSPTDNQNVPSFYTSSFDFQQALTNPFAFTQSSSVTDSINHSNNAAINLHQNANNVVSESSKNSKFTGNSTATSQSIWNSSPTQQQSAVPHSDYKPSIQTIPTFYNPTQFAKVSHSYPSIPSTHALESTDINSFIPSNNSPSCQLSTDSLGIFNAVPESTGSATLNTEQISVHPLINRTPLEIISPSFENLATGISEKPMQYRSVYQHWFYRREVETKTQWLPFSMHDSLNLEDVHNSNEISPETKVATDGGRYDVEILRRQRSPVYWNGPITEVRRCSWFYKKTAESHYTPYEEHIAARLEEEFKQACSSNNWNRRVDLNNGEYVMFESSTVQIHYLQFATTPERAASWENNSGSEDNAYLQSSSSRTCVVKRGMDEFNIDAGEPEKVDHLLFVVHGIGSVCDLKFRTVEEVVDDLRIISLRLIQSHYRTSNEQGIVNRVEVLPISWHAALHSGIDKKLQMITLENIPRMRHFTNDTLLDILFYTSPIYCETIMKTVGGELNRLYTLFNERNPNFQGSVYLGGHSLGSLILFDLLSHQKPPKQESKEKSNDQCEESEEANKLDQDVASVKPAITPVLKRKLSKRVSYIMGTAGTGQPYISYPQLAFQPSAFFALGSPIGMFVTVRGIENLGEDFTLPTCPAFFNIFHPFDPVAYRVESLLNSEAHKYRPMLIPHHKGRKRMHLELKETMAKVGADLKQKLIESVKSTWNSMYQMAMFHRQDNQQSLEQEIEKVVEEQMSSAPVDPLQSTSTEDADTNFNVGKLNGGRRVDYVLQEAPFECINKYLFALRSHVCYWDSEDTILLILKEIYGSMGIQTDAQLPPQTLTIERVSTPSNSAYSSNDNNECWIPPEMLNSKNEVISSIREEMKL